MIFRKAKVFAKKITNWLSAPFVINSYIKNTPLKKRKMILGSHWSDNSGWLILEKEHQDITKKLKMKDNSFSAIFLEHVFEHIDFDKGIFFLKEAKRVLCKNGVIRIVSPFKEKILSVNLGEKNKKNNIYIKNSLEKLMYPKYNKILKSLHLKGISEDADTFFLNSIFRESDHRFIWSAKLLKTVMEKIGYSKVVIYPPGKGFKKEYCIERKQRGIYLGNNWQKNSSFKNIFDPESLVVEGVK